MSRTQRTFPALACTFAAAALLSAGLVQASPSLQSCAPIEVIHNGMMGMSYSLTCQAGGWTLKYTGAVPSGSEPVNVQYHVSVRGVDGSAFTQNRSLSLPSPAHLGQMLAREAVLLESGDIALRECKEPSCTLYRPLGNQRGLAQATITVPPELQRVKAERDDLRTELQARTAALNAHQAQLEALTQALATAQDELDTHRARLADQVTELSRASHATEEANLALAMERDQLRAELELVTKQLGAERLERDIQVKAQSAEVSHEVHELLAALSQAHEHNELLRMEVAMLRSQLQADEAPAVIEESAEWPALLESANQALSAANRQVSAQQAQIESLTSQLELMQAQLDAHMSESEAQWKHTISTLLDDRHAARLEAREAVRALELKQAEIDKLKETLAR